MVFITLACPLSAQTGSGVDGQEGKSPMPPGMARGGMRSLAAATFMLIRAYDSKTVTTANGVLVSLDTIPPKSQFPEAMRSAILKTAQGNTLVILAPDWFLQEQKPPLKAGDAVEVTGSKINLQQGPSIIVRDLKVMDKTVALRNGRGFPLGLEGRPAK